MASEVLPAEEIHRRAADASAKTGYKIVKNSWLQAGLRLQPFTLHRTLTHFFPILLLRGRLYVPKRTVPPAYYIHEALVYIPCAYRSV